ncbi:hypothetical protein BT93_A0193 [Corymbia citriodora subsp. variegata]|nr:hypothetical protein BT93_A0193 [Corymbia citriodora subsp. variegata]
MASLLISSMSCLCNWERSSVHNLSNIYLQNPKSATNMSRRGTRVLDVICLPMIRSLHMYAREQEVDHEFHLSLNHEDFSEAKLCASVSV